MTKLFPDEADVKAAVRKELQDRHWKFWMPAANGFGTQGVSDFCALRGHVFMAVETKKRGGKPTTLQKDFLKAIIQQGGFGFVVTPDTMATFVSWMGMFDVARDRAARQLPRLPADEARMLDLISILQDPIYA